MNWDRRMFLAGLGAVPALAAAAYDADGQRKRRLQIYRLHTAACDKLFDADGVFHGQDADRSARVYLWHSMSLLAMAETRTHANLIIRRLFADRTKFYHSFSHFEFCAAVQLLARSRAELTPENRTYLSELLGEEMKHRRKIRWLGYNDNFPAMSTLVASLGGQFLDDSASRDLGMDAMTGLMRLFERRGMLSEYTSATYSPISLLCFADIAEHCTDAETRRLALAIEHRIWLDLAAHFHAPTNLLAGPHSRAYNVDSCGHLHQVHMVFYQAFGERVWLNPVRFLFPPVPKQLIHHDGDVPFMQASAVWIAGGTYHPDASIARLAFDKPATCRVRATAENGTAATTVMMRTASGKFESTGEPMDYQGGEVLASTYLTPDYSVGAASVQFHDGNQTDSFFVTFRRQESPRTLDGISTIFSRMAFNDDEPGRPWYDPRNAGTGTAGSTDLFADAGRVRAIQKDGTVLAVYQAKSQFLDDYQAIRLTIVIPEFYHPIRGIRVGDGNASSAAEPDIVWVEDDYLFAAFRPLLLTNHGRSDSVRVVRRNGYASIQFINYEGSPRRFTRKQLLETLNGFVAEIGSRAEYGTFDAFRKRVLSGKVEDEMAAGHRIASYSRPGVQLDIRHTIISGAVTYLLVDGKPAPQPLFEAPGVTL